MKKVPQIITAGIAALLFSQGSFAANWIAIQGTEPEKVSHRFFGAVSLQYSNYVGCNPLSGMARPNGTPTGDPNSGPGLNNGYYVNSCRVGPELHNDNKGFNLDAFVVGLRGNIIPGKINYFLTTNFGMNGATYEPLNTNRKHLVSLTDASVTLYYIPGARLRLGLFKKPGPEELLESIRTKDFIYLTDFVRRDQVERFVNGSAKGTNPIAGQGYAGSISTQGYDSDVGRDWGIQAFDSFNAGKWTHTYAAMIGNGNGIHESDNNNEKDLNLYFSSEYDLPGGKGAMKNGVKLYAYHQSGVRNYIVDAQGTKSEDFDRIRYGFGVQALGRFFGETGHKHRLGMDLMFAEGMILQSATTSCTDCPYGGQLQIASERENKAKGLTLEYGYYLNKNWQFDVRYSRNNLLYETINNSYWSDSDERIITELALGTTYHIAPKTSLTLNYVFRESEAPNAVTTTSANPAAINNALVKTSNANNATGSLGDVIGLRLRHIF
ncbi:hypothetical protein [Sedimenticola sp.]|uniref:hypothetical protein n=1 Tax=Sedimenticola sp. TaxID=1940285 RepID=UPI00258276F3|nr:hypothetical protein [Sedimenticola sp.]MCW8903963.1 hypothetical protein [Sedimenticola sp.]